jgi:hypothetical protein
MLLGEPPFTCPTTQAIVAKVLTERPRSLTARRSTVPPALERAIHVALQKLPADLTCWSAIPRFTIIGGFSSGADVAMRLAAAADPESRLHLDGCLALGPNLSIETCFLTSALATLRNRDDAALLAILRTVSGNASSLDEFVNLCNYAVSVVLTFRNDVAPLRAFGSGISTPFETEKLTPFAEWYRAGAAKSCQFRYVFEDTPMFRNLVHELQLRNLDDGLLGPDYQEGSVVAEAGTSHFDLIDPARVEDHVRALVDRLTDTRARLHES